MINFVPQLQPLTFDALVRQPGTLWLANNPNSKKYPALWTTCLADLEDAFNSLCGYSAMYIEDGSVDHYLSKDKHRTLIYEWNNYRYSSRRINGCKWTHDNKILDPFEVQPGWFRIILPSMQLVCTDLIPNNLRRKANFTLEKLKLVNHPKIIKRRKKFLELYQLGKLSLDGLRELAPMIAVAVEEYGI